MNTGEKDDISDGRNKKSTQRATDGAVRQLEAFLQVQKLPKLDNIATDKLPDILNDFYPAIKLEKSNKYHVQTLKCKRAALNRYLKTQRGMDIISDERFICCNEMFKGITVDAKKKGLGVKNSYPPITESDLHLLGCYFDNDYMNNPNP